MTERIAACHPALLTDTVNAIDRYMIDESLENPISLSGVTELVNRNWTGCANALFNSQVIYKALIELQAMDVLQFIWEPDWNGSHIRLLAEPKQTENMAELIRVTFHGFMGTYDNPTPYEFLNEVFDKLPGPQRSDSIELVPVLLNDLIQGTIWGKGTVLKVLRELRMIRALNYTAHGDGFVLLRYKNPSWIHAATYEKLFGATAF